AGGLGNRLSAVVDAMGRQWPAVIVSRLGQVDFIAAARPVLMCPERSGPGIEGSALLVAMTQRPDFRRHAFLAYEGVIRRRLAIRMNAHHLALMLVHVLSRGALIVLPQGNEQLTVLVERQPGTEMDAGRQLRLLTEDHLEVFQPRHIGTQLAAPHSGACFAGTASLGVTEVNQPIQREVR